MHELVSINAGSLNGSETCFNFDIINDTLVEMNEYLSLHIKLEDRNVWIKGSPYLNITIYDDDGGSSFSFKFSCKRFLRLDL